MKSAAVITVAALAVAGINLASTQAATNGPSTAPAQLQIGFKPTDKATQDAPAVASDPEIQNLISNAAEYAMTPKDMTKLVTLFTDAQQRSITKSKTFADNYGDKLNAQMDSISKAWKQKYGHDFAISNNHDVLSQTIGSIQKETYGKNKPETANVTMNGETKLQVPLIRENNKNWKINVPNSLTAEKLRGNLLEQLTEIDKQSAHWPANETDAYRRVTDHVFSALLDQSMPAHAQAGSIQQPVAKVTPQGQAAVKPISTTTTHHWYQFWYW